MENCPECNDELIPYKDEDMSCSCHICPPCSKCCDDRLYCSSCEDIIDVEEEETKFIFKPYVVPIPKCNIDSFIDYSTSRSGGWARVEGSFKAGLKQSEVIEKLGSFDKHHMFKMKWFSENKEYGTFKASWTTD